MADFCILRFSDAVFAEYPNVPVPNVMVAKAGTTTEQNVYYYAPWDWQFQTKIILPDIDDVSGLIQYDYRIYGVHPYVYAHVYSAGVNQGQASYNLGEDAFVEGAVMNQWPTGAGTLRLVKVISVDGDNLEDMDEEDRHFFRIGYIEPDVTWSSKYGGWFLPYALEVAGGGRYKNQIIAVGHKKIYFGEV